jgi:hypothetical protein
MHMNVIDITVDENACACKKITRPTPQTPFFIAEYPLGSEDINTIMGYVQSCPR